MIFIRHPVTDAPEGMCYGRTDVGLGAAAGQQMADLLGTLSPVRTLCTSPAHRCRTLADRIAARDGIDITIREELWELDFGAWEGRLWSDVPRDQIDAWAEDPWSLAPPGGESFAALSDRLSSVLADLPAQAVLVTHAGIIRAARMALNGETMDQVFSRAEPFCTPLEFSREMA